MAIFKNFTKAFNHIDLAIATGRKRALNRAAAKTKTFINRDIRKEISIGSKDLNKRLRLNKTAKGVDNQYSFRASIGIAIRGFYKLRTFNPKNKVVNIGKGKPYGSKRLGVTVRLGKKREFIPGAFLMDVKATQIVAKRKGKARRPTKEVSTTLFQDTVKRQEPVYDKFITQEYTRILDHEIQFALSKRLSKTSGDK